MLLTLFVLLVVAVVLVSISRKFGFGSILGYLLGGVLIGPSGLRLVTDVNSISEISELGVLILLFIIGLELRLPRIWAMRRSVFGLGAAQMIVTGSALAVIVHAKGQPWAASAILGLGLALSSTAIVLPMLAERNLLALTFHDQLPKEAWPTGNSRWWAVVENLLQRPRDVFWDDVRTPTREIGRLAAERLIGLGEGEGRDMQDRLPSLVVRQSSGPAPKA